MGLTSSLSVLQATIRHELAATAAALQHAEGHHRSRLKEMQRRYSLLETHSPHALTVCTCMIQCAFTKQLRDSHCTCMSSHTFSCTAKQCYRHAEQRRGRLELDHTMSVAMNITSDCCCKKMVRQPSLHQFLTNHMLS